MIEQDGARAGGALVEGEDVWHGGRSLVSAGPFLVLGLLVLGLGLRFRFFSSLSIVQPCHDRRDHAEIETENQTETRDLRTKTRDPRPTTSIYSAPMSQQTREVRREILAEFLGTFVLIMFGVGVVAQVVLSRSTAGSYLAINLVWGLAVTMGCYVAGGSPARTSIRRSPSRWRSIGDSPGARSRSTRWRSSPARSLASAVVYLTYCEALGQFDGGVRQVLGAQGTAGIWATYPQPFLSTLPGGFIDQVVGTAMLMAVICALTDTRNAPPGAGLAPVIVGLLVVAIGAAFGFNSGYAINPARDFGPRLFTALAGWGTEVFRAGQQLVVGADRGAAHRGRARRMAVRQLHRTPAPAQPGHRRGARGLEAVVSSSRACESIFQKTRRATGAPAGAERGTGGPASDGVRVGGRSPRLDSDDFVACPCRLRGAPLDRGRSSGGRRTAGSRVCGRTALRGLGRGGRTHLHPRERRERPVLHPRADGLGRRVDRLRQRRRSRCVPRPGRPARQRDRTRRAVRARPAVCFATTCRRPATLGARCSSPT